MKPLLGTSKIDHYCVIVKDVETSKKEYAEFFGIDVPPTLSLPPSEVTKTVYHGKPEPDAAGILAIIDLGNIRIELFQPNDAPSVQRDFLNEHGEGIQHIGIHLRGVLNSIEEGLELCSKKGWGTIQTGFYGDTEGNATGAYAFVDSQKDLQCCLELLFDFE